jgi:uncharacterized protein YdhG (YjbR/CyaY superfamily)
MSPEFKNVDEYINSFPDDVGERLRQMRKTIKQSAPDATEGISYNMPAYKLHGKPLVYFAAFKSHIGFYATPAGHSEFTTELSKYIHGKGSVQFPADKPLPLDLIARITKFKVKLNSGSRIMGKK